MDKHGDQPLIGVEEALARVRGNKAIYIRMLGLFLKSDQFHVMEELLSQGNFEKASEAAHGIKGMTGNLSLNRVFFLSADLMTQLRQGPPDE